MNSKTKETSTTEATNEKEPKPLTLKQVIEQQVTEEDKPMSASAMLRKIQGGDFLSANVLRRQVWVILIALVFILMSVSNRYSCQRDMLEINELNDILEDAKYKAIAVSSELTELSRESRVLEALKNNQDSTLKMPNQPPYIINIPKE